MIGDSADKHAKALDSERHKRHVLIKQTTKMWTVTRASRQAEMDALTRWSIDARDDDHHNNGLDDDNGHHNNDLNHNNGLDDDNGHDDNDFDYYNNDLNHNNGLDDNNGLYDNNGGATTEATARQRISLDRLTPLAGCGPWHQEPGRAHAPGLRPATVGHNLGRNGPRTKPHYKCATRPRGVPAAALRTAVHGGGPTHLRPIGR
eukprot:5978998-Heterocapsa_arctica.AAC.1